MFRLFHILFYCFKLYILIDDAKQYQLHHVYVSAVEIW